MLSNLISATCLLARAPLGRDVCPRSSHFGTDSGYPLSYEMRRSLGGIKDVMPHLPFPCGNPGRAALCSRGHRSDGTYVLAHLTSARTAGVRCPMKCLVRPPLSDSKLQKKNATATCCCDCAFFEIRQLAFSCDV